MFECNAKSRYFLFKYLKFHKVISFYTKNVGVQNGTIFEIENIQKIHLK